MSAISFGNNHSPIDPRPTFLTGVTDEIKLHYEATKEPSCLLQTCLASRGFVVPTRHRRSRRSRWNIHGGARNQPLRHQKRELTGIPVMKSHNEFKPQQSLEAEVLW
jgi:hypothetical protein